MTSDRELLEKAAKAAGIALEWADNGSPGFWGEWRGLPQWEYWNPLTDDGDALRLAVKLNIDPMFDLLMADGSACVSVTFPIPGDYDSVGEPTGTDPYAATRRAIVRAAAAMEDAK